VCIVTKTHVTNRAADWPAVAANSTITTRPQHSCSRPYGLQLILPSLLVQMNLRTCPCKTRHLVSSDGDTICPNCPSIFTDITLYYHRALLLKFCWGYGSRNTPLIPFKILYRLGLREGFLYRLRFRSRVSSAHFCIFWGLEAIGLWSVLWWTAGMADPGNGGPREWRTRTV